MQLIQVSALFWCTNTPVQKVRLSAEGASPVTQLAVRGMEELAGAALAEEEIISSVPGRNEENWNNNLGIAKLQ